MAEPKSELDSRQNKIHIAPKFHFSASIYWFPTSQQSEEVNRLQHLNTKIKNTPDGGKNEKSKSLSKSKSLLKE